MSTTTDVVIVGGGVIGCAIAYFLRKAGIDVTIIEHGEIGAEASSAAAGLLAPLGSLSGPGQFADLLLASFAMFPELVPELEETSDLHVDYELTGALRIGRTPKSVANLRQRMRAWQPLGLRMDWLTGDEVRQRDPIISPQVSAGLYAPEEAQIQAPLLARAYARGAARQGAKMIDHCEVTGIQQHNGKVTGIATARGDTIPCSHLVVATGAWSARTGKWLRLDLRVQPQRGQILALRQPAIPLRHILFGEAVYLAPKADSTVIVGATREEVGFEKELTAGGVAWLLDSAIRLVPSFEHSPIARMWAGLRPKTPDNYPFLGPAPDWHNVTLAIGHGSVGIMLSAITGKTIADVVTTGRVPELIQPFALDRPRGPIEVEPHGEW